MNKLHPENLDNFFESTKTDVDKMIDSIIDNKKIVKILTAGKRLRPLVAKLSFKVCTGGKETPYQYQRFIESTVAIELAHTASLVHDDIIDRSHLRRGKPSMHAMLNTYLKKHKGIKFNVFTTGPHRSRSMVRVPTLT